MVVREDAHSLFGFVDPQERQLFRNLISVSGIGPKYSSNYFYPPINLKIFLQQLLTKMLTLLKGIKGIGVKTLLKES